MAVEASVMKKLEKLRNWQIEAQSRLIQIQQEQREKLSIEQKQIYETLGLSMDSITNDTSLLEKLSMLQVSTSTDEDAGSPETKLRNYDNAQDLVDFKTEKIIAAEREANSQIVSSDDTDEFNTSLNSSYEVLNKINYEHEELPVHETPKKYQNSPLMDFSDVQSLSLTNTPSKCIDDIPVPSPKKDFETLLEEKLKDSGAIKTNANNDNNVKNGLKRPFLKKGSGLARYRIDSKAQKNNKNIEKSKPKNAPLSSKLTATKVQRSSSTHCTAKQKKNTETRRRTIHGISPRSTVIPKIPQQKLNLKNVPLPKKVFQRRSLPAVLVKSPEPDKISITSNEQSETDELDLDNSRLETKMFEMLEERADNSSFCSNSSAVIDFLRQSTPIKLRNIRKTIQSRQNSEKINTDVRNNDDLKKIGHFKNSTSDKDTRCLINENQPLKDIDTLKIIQKSLASNSLHNVGHQLMKSSKCQDYSDIDDTICVLSTKNAKSFGLIKTDYHEPDKNSEADVSVHVRFADYNEYKSISDISMLSKDSYDHDDKISSNHSTSAESDTDISIDKPEMLELKDSSDSEQSSGSKKIFTENRAEIFDNQSTDNEQSTLDDSDDSDFDNTILESQEPMKKVSRWSSSDIMEECNEKMKAHHTDIREFHQAQILDDTADTILKSELLKSRLLELEREIEIFRKENSALMVYRQKLNNEQNRLRKEYEEKHKDLKMEKIQMKNALEEEKKRVIREKSALEHRLKDAREKSLQTKQERLEIQSLKEKLERLQDDMNEKENRSQAAQARQRSQIRVLQMENTKLKEEVARLQALGKNNSRLRKPMAISNTKAIHEINKQLDNYRNSIEQDEEDIKKEEKKSKLPVKSHPEKIESTSNQQITKSTSTEDEKVAYDQSIQVMGNRENNPQNTLQKRYLYESLLKDATNEYVINYDSLKQQKTHDENIENRNSNSLAQMNDKETKIQINDGLKNSQFDPIINYQNSSLSRNSVHNNQKVALSEQSSDNSPRIVQKSYKQFVQEVINTKNDDANAGHQYSQRTVISHESSPQEKSIQTISTSDFDKNSTGRSNQLVEYNSQRQVPVMAYGNNITNSQNGLSEFRDMNADLNPRIDHQQPLPQSTANIVPTAKCDRINHISTSYTDNKCSLPTAQQNIREVKHPDGHIEYWYSNGNVKRVYPDRNISKMIYYNGDVCETAADGCIKYFYAATKTWQTTYPDGFEILEFPDGQQERRTTDGVVEVSFPDGSVRLIQPDGIEKWALSDGTIAEIFRNGDKILSFSNGQREIHTSDHKRREYPDGTVKFIYLDGTQETRYSNGRIRMKDKDGNLIMDSY